MLYNNDYSILEDNDFRKLLGVKKLHVVLCNNGVPVVREGVLNGIRFNCDDEVKDDSKRDYSFELELYGNKDLLSSFDSKDINKTVFFTKEEAEKRAEVIKNQIDVCNDSLSPIKITQFKYYRINFTYQDKHYSISEKVDGAEEAVFLTCKEDEDFCKYLGSSLPYIPCKKQGQTYKNMDLSNLYDIIEKYIETEPKTETELEDDEIER